MEYLLHLGTLVCLSAIFAVSLDLLIGYTGMISVTHATFGGIGVYTTAILMKSYGVNFFLALPAGVLLAAAMAVFVGAVFSRFKGDYFLLGTIAVSYIGFTLYMNLGSITGGPLGMPGIPRPVFFGFSFSDSLSFFLLALAALATVYAASRFIVRSSFGRVLTAIREDEEAISVFGYRTFFYKLAIFGIAAGMCAFGGALYGPFFSYVDPFSFALVPSVYILTVVLLGGAGSLRGPVAGAAVLLCILEGLRFAGFSPDVSAQLQQVIYGFLLIGIMMYRPQGLFGEFKL